MPFRQPQRPGRRHHQTAVLNCTISRRNDPEYLMTCSYIQKHRPHVNTVLTHNLFGPCSSRPAATTIAAAVQSGPQFIHDIGVFEIQGGGLTRVRGEVVELTRSIGR